MRTVDEILDKIKDLKGLGKDADLARLFSVKPQTVASWRARKTLPHDLIITYCEQENISLSWLLTGQINTKYINVDGKEVLTVAQEPGMFKSNATPEYRPEVLQEVVETVEEIFAKDKLHLPPGKKAELITLLYEELIEDESKRAELPSRARRLLKLAS